MSLINDALRRAQKNHKSPDNPSTPAPMQPVGIERVKTFSGFTGLILFVALIVVAAIFFIWSGLRPASTSTTLAPIKTSSAEISPPFSSAVTPSPPRVDANSKPALEPSSPAKPVVESALANNVVLTNAPPEVAPLPVLKLQGIFFRLRKPTALINGKTVELGDIVAEARVTKIERQRVFVEQEGKILILKIE